MKAIDTVHDAYHRNHMMKPNSSHIDENHSSIDECRNEGVCCDVESS
jgi:hypothetical protein